MRRRSRMQVACLSFALGTCFTPSFALAQSTSEAAHKAPGTVMGEIPQPTEVSSEDTTSKEIPTTQKVALNQEPAPVQEPLPSAAEVKALREEMRALTITLAAVQSEIDARKEAEQSAAQETAKNEDIPTPLDKGNFYIGGTLGGSYKGRNNVGTIFGTVDDGHRYRTSIQGLFGRVLKKNELAVGMIVRYEHSSQNGFLTDLDTGTTDNRQSTEYSLTAGPAVRQFLPLDPGHKLFIYYQAAFIGGIAEKVTRVTGSDSSTVSSAIGYNLSLNIQPGVMVAAGEHFAVEMGINLLGVDYSHFKTTTDYETVGTENNGSITVDVNLLSLQFAFVGYF